MSEDEGVPPRVTSEAPPEGTPEGPLEARGRQSRRRATPENPPQDRGKQARGPRRRACRHREHRPKGGSRSPHLHESWPRDESLDGLVAAFVRCDYARVRREAPALARATEDDAVRRAARELRRRLDPDPVAVYMLMAAGALLVFLAGWYWLHPHTPVN